MPGALTHIRITWALSPNGAISPGCDSKVPVMSMVFWTILMEGCAFLDHLQLLHLVINMLSYKYKK